MSFLHPVPELSKAAADMLQKQSSHFGYLPNYARPFVHRPELMQLWSNLQRGARGQLSNRLYELVTFAAAVELGSSYCALAHGSKLLEESFTSAEIANMALRYYPCAVTVREARAMEYARLIARNASSVTEEDIESLRQAGITDDEIFDIAAVAAARAFFSKLVDGVGSQPDAVYGELPFSQELTVGRAIDEDEQVQPLFDKLQMHLYNKRQILRDVPDVQSC